MDYKNLKYERTDKGVGYISLARPQYHNAINGAMFAELNSVFRTAETDASIKVLVIKGEGRDFSTGEDLSEPGSGWRKDPGDQTGKIALRRRKWLRFFEYIFNLTKPVIAQVHGKCLGSACSLMMSCDMSFAAENAEIGDNSIRYGLLPQSPLWLWLLSQKKARALLFTGLSVSGRKAEEIGLVNKAVQAADLDKVVNDFASEMAMLPSDALVATKDSLNAMVEARGTGASWRLTGNMQFMMDQIMPLKGEFDFNRLTKAKGLETALEEYKARFGSLAFSL